MFQVISIALCEAVRCHSSLLNRASSVKSRRNRDVYFNDHSDLLLDHSHQLI